MSDAQERGRQLLDRLTRCTSREQMLAILLEANSHPDGLPPAPEGSADMLYSMLMGPIVEKVQRTEAEGPIAIANLWEFSESHNAMAPVITVLHKRVVDLEARVNQLENLLLQVAAEREVTTHGWTPEDPQ